MGRLRAVGGACFAAALCLATAACGSDAPSAADTLPKVEPTAYVTIVPITTTTTLPPVPTTPPPFGSVSTEPQIHTVAAGDSFGKIAAQYGITVDAILLFNQFADSGQLLLPGEAIGIPAGARVPGTGTGLVPTGTPGTGTTGTGPVSSDVATGSTVATEDSGAGCTYTIVAGDSPGAVASRYGISFDELQAANPARDFTEWFLVTATISIPAGATC